MGLREPAGASPQIQEGRGVRKQNQALLGIQTDLPKYWISRPILKTTVFFGFFLSFFGFVLFYQTLLSLYSVHQSPLFPTPLFIPQSSCPSLHQRKAARVVTSSTEKGPGSWGSLTFSLPLLGSASVPLAAALRTSQHSTP